MTLDSRVFTYRTQAFESLKRRHRNPSSFVLPFSAICSTHSYSDARPPHPDLSLLHAPPPSLPPSPSLPHSLTLSLPPSIPPTLTPSLPHSLTPSLPHPHSLPPSLPPHAPTHSFTLHTRSLTHVSLPGAHAPCGAKGDGAFRIVPHPTAGSVLVANFDVPKVRRSRLTLSNQR